MPCSQLGLSICHYKSDFSRDRLRFYGFYNYLWVYLPPQVVQINHSHNPAQSDLLWHWLYFWNLDNNFCEHLKSYRGFLDAKFGIDGSSNVRSVVFNALVVCLKSIFEFHSLWHIFVGFGTYTTILFFLESNYQLHLSRTNKLVAGGDESVVKRNKQVINSKYCNMYYHLTNELLEKERNAWVVNWNFY